VKEHPLGGNLSAAVKVGDTVRRRAGPWTPAVHALLDHLHHAGFGAAPEPLGMDEGGRAVLKFIPGEVHQGWPDPMPSWMFEDEATLIGAAELLRRYHDLAATFTPRRDARWRIVAPGAPEVICHNDWAPYNALFEGHRPLAILDWDSAGPGSRVWDVGLSAYNWVPLYPKANIPNVPPSMRASRLATFCAAYGGVEPSDVLESLVRQLPFLADFIQAQADAGDPGFVKLAGWNVPARTREHARLIREQMPVLLRRV
jgi:Ser/Thr protein kinase RdoA (MazF antagonist)